MAIPLTRACPQCEGEMELLTTDDDGEVLLYECADCGYQVEMPADGEEDSLDDEREPDELLPDAEEDEPDGALDPDDEG
jgi:Zn ribbon nucleic-acid-binding protein